MENIRIKRIAYISISSLFFYLLTTLSYAQNQRNLFKQYLDSSYIAEVLIPADKWEPFPKKTLAFTYALPDSVISTIIQNGETALDYKWLPLTASLMLDYSRRGNRTRYQNRHFERRDKLRDLILAEFIEDSGRFTDQVVNGIWSICEESYWGVPAHLYLQKGAKELVNTAEPTVDIFVAETASLLSWAYYLHKDKLDEISPRINERIKNEINNRLLKPNLERKDFSWMGFDLPAGRRINNWNPWIVSNWLTAALIFEEDKEKRVQTLLKIMKVLGNFVNPYPADGGCDEGPSYWGHAGASLFDCLELLYSATNGNIDVYNQSIIDNIATYIYKVYIGNSYFVNFADATAKLKPNADLIYRFGKRINNVQMQKFGKYLKVQSPELDIERNLFRSLSILKNHETLFNNIEGESDFKLPIDVWLPESEIMVGRSNPNNKGFFVAAKAGHNAESHNHNDVGSFILYYNALPVLVDAGVGTYTAKTFSNERYNFWNMQSAFHNLPTINGHMQSAGVEYKAKNVSYKSNANTVRLKMGLANAYPAEAGISSLTRTIQLNRNKNLILTDKYVLNSSKDKSVMSFITPCKVTITEPGEIRLLLSDNGVNRTVYINYDASQFSVKKEVINMEGEENTRLRKVWTEGLTRILLTDKRGNTKGTWKFLFSSY